MFKNVFLAAALTGFLAGALVPVQSSTAEAGQSGCRKAANAKYTGDWKAKHEYRKWCRAEWKAHKKAMKAAS